MPHVRIIYLIIFFTLVITQKVICSHYQNIPVTLLDLVPEGKMPIVGLGTYADSGEHLEKALDLALNLGYRHIDTSFFQQNEGVIGKVLNRWLSLGKLNRSDLFITTKLPPTGMRYESIPKFLKQSLEQLQLDYVDIYHLHMPMGFKDVSDELVPLTAEGTVNIDYETDHIGIWKGMEELVQAGVAKSIGICNFNIKQITRLLKNSRIPPSNLQIELNVYNQEENLVRFCKANNITVTAYFSLGNPEAESDPPNVLGDPTVQMMAQKYNKTPAQMLLRHLVQKEIAVLPKTIKEERLKENIYVFDFVVSEDDMRTLNGLDKGMRVFDYSLFEGSDPPNVLDDPTVEMMAQKYNRTSAQMLLRHLVQKEIAVLPKTIKEERLKENINIFDLVVSEEDMRTLNGLDKGMRVFDYSLFEGYILK